MTSWVVVCFAWDELDNDKSCFWIPASEEKFIKELEEHADSDNKEGDGMSLTIEKASGWTEAEIRKLNTMPVGNDWHGIVKQPGKLDFEEDWSDLQEQLRAMCD